MARRHSHACSNELWHMNTTGGRSRGGRGRAGSLAPGVPSRSRYHCERKPLKKYLYCMSLLSSHNINRYVLYRAEGTVAKAKCCSIQLRPLLWACPPPNSTQWCQLYAYSSILSWQTIPFKTWMFFFSKNENAAPSRESQHVKRSLEEHWNVQLICQRTNWYLSDRLDPYQARTCPCRPIWVSNLSKRMWWSMVSKAALRYRRGQMQSLGPMPLKCHLPPSQVPSQCYDGV